MNGGNPTLFWQKAEAEEEIGNYVRFAREMVTTLDGDETSLPTALLKWSAQKDAAGYLVGLWQKVRVWKGLTDEELKKLTTEPTATRSTAGRSGYCSSTRTPSSRNSRTRRSRSFCVCKRSWTRSSRR